MSDERIEVIGAAFHGTDWVEAWDAASVALAALEAAGYSVVKLEHIGWWGEDEYDLYNLRFADLSWDEESLGNGADHTIYRKVTDA